MLHHPPRREEALMATHFSGSERGGVRKFGFFIYFFLRHKRQPMCSWLVCDSGVMNVTAVIRASAVSVLDIHENDGI